MHMQTVIQELRKTNEEANVEAEGIDSKSHV